jgi:hypothetical protein
MTIAELERLLDLYRPTLSEIVEANWHYKILSIVRQGRGVTRGYIASQLGLTNSPWLRALLTSLVQQGLILCHCDRKPYLYEYPQTERGR